MGDACRRGGRRNPRGGRDHFPRVLLYVGQPGAARYDLFYELGAVWVTSVDIEGATADSAPTETVEMVFGAMEVDYTPAGGATLASTAGSAAGFGALQTMAEEGAKLGGTDGQKDWGGAALAVGKSAILNGLGALLGGALGKALKAQVLAQILKAYPGLAPAVAKKVEDFIEGAIGGVVQTVVSNMSDVAAGKMTVSDLAVLVAENMIAGGVGGVIGTTVPLKRP